MEPCPRHLQFFLRRLAHLQVPSWTSLQLTRLDATHFGGMAPACKHLTCMVEVEGVAAFLSPGAAELLASMDFFWPTARTFARMVSEGAGTWCSAKMWCSKQASPTGMDEAQKRCWAWSSRLHHSSSPITRFLCSSLSVVMAFNSFSC